MAGNVVELLFRLTADSTTADKTVKDLEANYGAAFKAVSAAGQNAFSGLTSQVNQLAGSIPVIGPAAAAASNALLQTALSTKQASTAVQQVGVDFNSLIPVLGQLDAAFTKANKTGGTDLFNTLKSLGVATRDADGAFTADIDHLKTLADRFAGMSDQAGKAAIAQDIFGAKGKQNVVLLEQWSKEGEQATASTASLATETEAAASSFGIIGIAIAVAIAAMAAEIAIVYELESAIVDAAKEFADFGLQLEKASEKTKLTTQELAGLKLVADENKVNFDQLVTGLGRYIRNVDLAAKGNKALAKEFQDLGIDAKTAAANPEEAVKQLFEAFNKLGPGVQENETLIRLFGRAGIEMIPVLRDIHGNLDEATQRAKEFGVSLDADGAQKAKALTKELVDLDKEFTGIKLAIGEAATPAVIELAHAFGTLLTAMKPAIELIAWVGTYWLGEFSTGAHVAADAVLLLTGRWKDLYDAEKKAHDEEDRRAANAIPEQGGTSASGVAPKAPSAQKAQSEIEQSATDDLKAAYDKQKRITEQHISDIQNLLKLGRINQEQETHLINAENAIKLKAEEDFYAGEIRLKKSEQDELDKTASDYTKKSEKFNAEILDLQSKMAEAQNKANIDENNRTVENQVAARSKLVEHMNNVLAIETSNRDTLLKINVEKNKLGLLSDSQAEVEREKIEDTGYVARLSNLKKQADLNATTVDERTKLKEEILKVENEATNNLQVQAARRAEIARGDAEFQRQIKLNEISTDLQLDKIRTDMTIASIKALADMGVKTYEQAAEDELKARIRLLDAEAKALDERRKLDEKITDPKQRATALASLNSQVKILVAEGTAIIADGERKVDDGRKEDLQKQQEYNDKYEALLHQKLDIDKQTSQLELELLKASHGPQSAVIDAELKEQETAETEKNASILRSLKNERDAAFKSIIGTEDELEKRNEVTAEYNAALEKEKARHDKAMGLATVTAEQAKKVLNPFADAIGRINDKFGEGTFKADVFTAGLGALSQAASAVADAVGQMAASFVLYGSTGESFGKVAAQVIAAIAQQATVQALYQLAQGLAWEAIFLFTGDTDAQAAAALAFESAAAFGVIAAIAIPVGRAVAGDKFKDTSSASGGGGGTSSGTTSVNVAYGSGNQSGSNAARGGSGSPLQQHTNALNNVATALNSFQSLPPGVLVKQGIPQAVTEIGQATLQHSAANQRYGATLAEHMGFKN